MAYESGTEPARPGSHQLVVCVSDPDLLNLIRRYCAALPCQTHSTESPDEALSLLEGGRISLVLADQHLKIMSGTQLLKEVARRSPLTARVLLASFPENHNISEHEDERLHGIIGKPWDGPSFQRTILAILEWQVDRSRSAGKGYEAPSTFSTPTRSIRNPFNSHGENRRRPGAPKRPEKNQR